MKRQFSKSCMVVGLAIIFLYSGVAGAVASCLGHDHHLDFRASEQHHQHQVSRNNHEDPHDPSLPVIHCTSVSHQAGPAVRGASIELTQFTKGLRFQTSLLPQALSPVFGNSVWREAVFRKVLPISLPADLARHLFLSVLQI
jgi:hypothetical protein